MSWQACRFFFSPEFKCPTDPSHFNQLTGACTIIHERRKEEDEDLRKKEAGRKK
jgi:hypothetical protein